MLQVHRMVVGLVEENTYAIVNPTGQALIVDPGGEAEHLIEWIEQAGWQPVAILLTHGHFDHIGAVDALKAQYQIPFYLHEEEVPLLTNPQLNSSALMATPIVVDSQPDGAWQQMGQQEVGGFNFEVVFVPGHSPAHVAYIFHEGRFVMSGDTIFEQSIGRTDLPGGSYVTLMQSIYRELIQLPTDYVLYPGHGNAITVGDALATNPYFEVFRNIVKHRVD